MKITPHAQPGQTFFDDPANDRMLAMLMTLAAEFWVVSDRLRAMETLLAERGVLRREDLDHYSPDPETEKTIAAERRAFVQSLMEPVLGRELSRGAPDSLLPGGRS